MVQGLSIQGISVRFGAEQCLLGNLDWKKSELSDAISELRCELRSYESQLIAAQNGVQSFRSNSSREESIKTAWTILKRAAVALNEIEYFLKVGDSKSVQFARRILDTDFRQEKSCYNQAGLNSGWKTQLIQAINKANGVKSRSASGIFSRIFFGAGQVSYAQA